MTPTTARGRAAVRAVPLLALLVAGTAGAQALPSTTPTLWGYGVKRCSDFLAVAPQVPDGLRGGEYGLYREWLAGLVSGLNLATAGDVLAGAELEAALGRIRAQCTRTPEADFFTASLALIKSLSARKGERPAR